MNKKQIYENIMRSISKEVKKVLSESVNVGPRDVLETLKERFISNGDGIYIVYYDHVSSDAYYVFVINDGKCIEQTRINYYIDYDFRTRGTSGHYNICGGLVHKIRSLNELDLQVFYANIGYHSFMCQWETEDVSRKRIKEMVKDFQTGVIDIDCSDLI